MKIVKLFCGLLALLLLAGCVPSLYPLYTEKDLIFEPALIGAWNVADDDKEKEKDTWTFQKDGENSYRLVVTDKQVPAEFTAHLLQLGKYRFLDLFPIQSKAGNEFYRGHWLPSHTFWKVTLAGDTLALASLDADWLKQNIDDKKITIAHDLAGENNDAVILSASTGELQKFVLQFAEDPKVFHPPTDDKYVIRLNRKP